MVTPLRLLLTLLLASLLASCGGGKAREPDPG